MRSGLKRCSISDGRKLFVLGVSFNPQSLMICIKTILNFHLTGLQLNTIYGSISGIILILWLASLQLTTLEIICAIFNSHCICAESCRWPTFGFIFMGVLI